jgi:hypothetical protein
MIDYYDDFLIWFGLKLSQNRKKITVVKRIEQDVIISLAQFGRAPNVF